MATTRLDTLAQPLMVRVLSAIGRPLVGPVLVAIAYYVGAEAAFAIGTLSDRIFAPFWPPNIILFAALLLSPRERWWLYIAAAFLPHVVAEAGVGMPVPQMLVAFATNCALAVFNAVAVRWMLGGPPWFGGLGKAGAYIGLTALAGPALVALAGAFVPILGGGALGDFWTFWANWFAGNSIGALTLGPVLLTWTDAIRDRAPRLHRAQLVEAVVLVLALVATCIASADLSDRALFGSLFPALAYLPLPVVLWASVRFGETGASGSILVVTVVSIWATLQGIGPFTHAGPETNVLSLQLFLIGVSVPVLLLGAAIEQLRQAERTTRGLAASLLKVQDDERRRIARDLHDTTGQNLAAAGLLAGRVKSLVPSGEQPLVRQMEELIQLSMNELRTVSYLLHPPLLDQEGLASALRNYVEGFSERSGIKVDLDIAPELDGLAEDTEIVLFRIVQEALTNVSRHSGSPVAWVRLGRQSGWRGEIVVVTIEDIGKGFAQRDEAARASDHTAVRRTATGVGLQSMQARLRELGGTLEIQSIAGRTTLTGTMPFTISGSRRGAGPA